MIIFMARYCCSGTPGSRVRIAVAQYPQNHFNDYKGLCGIFSNRNFRVKSSNNNTATRFQPNTRGLTCTAINKEAFRVFLREFRSARPLLSSKQPWECYKGIRTIGAKRPKSQEKPKIYMKTRKKVLISFTPICDR